MTIEPNGKDLATARRLAGPQQRDRPRGVRARAAAQLPVRVPEHRRQEDVDLEGSRRRRPHDRRASCRRSSCGSCSSATARRPRIEFDPEGTDAIPRLFDEFDRLGGRHRRPRGQGRAARRATTSIFRYSLLDPNADVASAAARVPPGLRAPRAARAGARASTSRRASRPRRAPRSTDAEAAELRDPPRRGPPLARGVRPRARPDRDPARRAPGRGRAAARPSSAASCARSPRRPSHGDAPATGEQWQAAIFAVARRPRPRRQGRLQRPVPRVPRPAQRPARRLAPREPRPPVRRPAAPRGAADLRGDRLA